MLLYDRGNLSYSESWMRDFKTTFEQDGGVIAVAIPFDSGPDVHFRALARRVLVDKPDGLVIIANAVDAALICQQMRAIDTHIQIGTSEWAATEQVIELGGKAIEGIYQAQLTDRFSVQPEYLQFRQSYLKRFGKEPGYAGVTAFDATNVILEALARKQPEQSLKETILAIGKFKGLQEPMVFDASGEAPRKNIVTVIKNGHFKVLEP